MKRLLYEIIVDLVNSNPLFQRSIAIFLRREFLRTYI